MLRFTKDFGDYYRIYNKAINESKSVDSLSKFENWIKDYGGQFLIVMGGGHPNKEIQSISRNARNGFDLMLKLYDAGLLDMYINHYEIPIDPADVKKLSAKYA